MNIFEYFTTLGFFVQDLNNNAAELLLLFVAIVTSYLGYREYVLKRRPYIFPELIFELIGDDWYFHFKLGNTGQYPAIAKIQKAQLTIGDEVHPTVFQAEMLIPVGETIRKLAPVGHINKIGRSKIIGHEYKNNRVEIDFEIVSKPLQARDYKYSSRVKYNVNVQGGVPVVELVAEDFF